MNAVAFSPDGKTIASAGDDTTVHCWESVTGKLRFAWDRHRERVCSVAYSPDGKTVASGGYDGTVWLWDAKTGKYVLGWESKQTKVLSLSYSPDGKTLVSAGQDRTVRVWEAATGKQLVVCEGNGFWYRTVACSPNGQTLAAADTITSRIQFWNTRTGRRIVHVNGHDAKVSSITFSPDGQTLASAAPDETVRLWKTTTGEQIRFWENETRYADNAVAFSPDGKTLVCPFRETTRLLEAAGESVFDLSEPRAHHTLFTFSPHGRRLATISEATVTIWDITARKLISQREMENEIGALACSPDGKVLALGEWNGRINLLDAATSKPILGKQVALHCPVLSLAYAPDGKVLAWGDWEGSIRLLDGATAEQISLCKGPKDQWVKRIAFSPDSTTLASLAGHTLYLWETSTRRLILVHKGKDKILSLAYSPDGRILATGSEDTTVLLWDVFELILAHRRSAEHGSTDLPALWADLTSQDAGRGYTALAALIRIPERSVPFLRDHLHPVLPAKPQYLAKLIANLDADDFATRELVEKELATLGETAEPALRAKLAVRPSPEARRRVQRLLTDSQTVSLSPNRLRSLRAIIALERMGTAGALHLLTDLSRGEPGARLTQAAGASLRRLANRPTPHPKSRTNHDRDTSE